MDKLQSDILLLSTQLFCKYGLKSVSIDDICSQLGISKKTFYNYYKQKSDLIADALEQVHNSNSKMSEWMSKLNSEKELNAIDKIQEIKNYFKNNKEKAHHSFFYDLTKYYPKIYEQFNKNQENQTLAFARAEIEKGIAEGVYRKDIDIEMAAKFLSFQFSSILNSVQKRSEIQAAFNFLVDAYLRIMVNEKGMKYYQDNYLNKL
ncbi:MAG: TetR/AcrR family transcriptional regulator [Paludibacteraceae bacterium]|nr:TetR/AcrR family transcriptional regulator [Paludibacteraceae bacterium]MBN2787721.1 TetR/AcrR family transcriptional regulator [Paludibacteraceae bacterium]